MDTILNGEPNIDILYFLCYNNISHVLYPKPQYEKGREVNETENRQKVAELVGHVWSAGVNLGAAETLQIRKFYGLGVAGKLAGMLTEHVGGFVRLDAPSFEDEMCGWARIGPRGHIIVATRVYRPSSHQGLHVQASFGSWLHDIMTVRYAQIPERRQAVFEELIQSLEKRLTNLTSTHLPPAAHDA